MKDKNWIYKHYFYTCLNWNQHMDIIVDESNDIKGILFGSIEDCGCAKEREFESIDKKLEIWTEKHIQQGDFGDQETAVNRFKEFLENDRLGEMYADEFDSEVNLFIVSPELRGMGYGIKLMDRYVEFLRRNNLRTAFLWTDIGCTYSFYDKYGFKLYKKYYSKNLSENDSCDPNGMIYFLELNK